MLTNTYIETKLSWPSWRLHTDSINVEEEPSKTFMYNFNPQHSCQMDGEDDRLHKEKMWLPARQEPYMWRS